MLRRKQNRKLRGLRFFYLAFVLLWLAQSGCAYRWGQSERMIPGGHNSVAVPMFVNKTHETGIEVYFTNALIEELDRSQVFVTKKDQAEAIIEGVIETVNFVSGAQKSADSSNHLPPGSVLNAEYRILVSTRLQIRRIQDQKILWSARFSGEKSYPAPQVEAATVNSVNSLYNHSAHHQTIKLMAHEMMAEAYQQMTENF